ncbi:U5 snRNP protein, DIM1 family [Nematocida sp. AWRm77]|nr:U5 snRNP protein, DIM1 family [Nematocida sp. AWRm77]
MSFYLPNIENHAMFLSVIQKNSFVLIRLGEAGTEACQRLDKILKKISRSTCKYITMAAYETKDVPANQLVKHLAPQKPQAAVSFFYQSKPVLLHSDTSDKVYATEAIQDIDMLLSLIILVRQGVSCNTHSVYIPMPIKKSVTDSKSTYS